MVSRKELQTLLVSTVKPHPLGMASPDLRTASLDHAMWFHAPCRVDEWLYFEADCQRAGGGRGLARGRFFTQDGILVATCMQECLQRRLQ